MGHLPFEDRYEMLKVLIASVQKYVCQSSLYFSPLLTVPIQRIDPSVRLVTQTPCKGLEHLWSYYSEIEKLGGEGIMLRKPGSLYEGKRSDTLLKIKRFQDAEAVVIEHIPGTGKHKGRMGSMLVRMESGKLFKIGTGFSDAQRETPPPIGSIVTYSFQELTPCRVPRFPSFVSQRLDAVGPKDP
jgi:DNA ligase-1